MFFQFQFLKAFLHTTVYVYNTLILILTTRWPGPPQIKFWQSNLNLFKPYSWQNKKPQSKHSSDY